MAKWSQVGVLLVLGIALALWTGRSDFVPPGPGQADAGFGAGSDWDVQWAQGEALRSSASRGDLPHWDPMPDFGAPLLAHPESWVAAPAFLASGGASDLRSGLRGLRAVSVIALVLGLGLLCVRMQVPWMVGVTGAVAVLASDQWAQRLYSGHLMALGMCWWPLAAAAVLRACESATATVQWRMAAAAGACIGLASLQGGHYPTVFAPWVLGLVAWGAVAGDRWVGALLGLAALGLLPFQGPPALSLVVSAAFCAVLLAGLAASSEARRVGRIAAGGALGALAVAGFRLVPGVWAGLSVGRVAPPSVGSFESVPWGELATFSGAMEGALQLGHPALGWAVVAAALVAVVDRRLRGVAVSTLVLLLVAWGAGRGLSSWPALSLIPGMSGINYPLRLQWPLLVFGPVLLGSVASSFLTFALSERRADLLASAAALVVTGALLGATEVEDRTPEGTPVHAATGSQEVRGSTTDDDALLADAARDGLIREHRATALGYPELERPVPDWIPDEGRVLRGGTLALTGSPGDEVVVPQRALAGWRCEGAELLEPPSAARWLAVRLVAPRATCRWHTPWLSAGLALQGLAILLLIALTHRARRPSMLAPRPLPDVRAEHDPTPAEIPPTQKSQKPPT